MFKNFLKLFSGNAISQAIQLLALLYLTNLYLPDDFGKLGKIQSFGSILAIVITLQMNHVIPLSKSKEYALEITRVIFSLSLINFLASFVLLLFIPLDYGFGIFLSLVLGLSNTINGFLIFKGKFSVISILYIVRAIAIVGLQYLFHVIDVKNGLLYGAIIGEFIGFLYLYIRNYQELTFRLNFNLRLILNYLKNWTAFSLHGTIQELLSVAVYALPMIFYTEKFGENVGGQYSIAYKVIWAPAVLVSSSLAQVLYHKFNQEDGFKFLENYFWFNKKILLLIPIVLFLLFNIHFLDLSALNNKWDITFQLLPYLFINAIFFILANPYRVALRVLKLNKQILKVEFFTLVSIVAIFLFVNLDVLFFTISITVVGIVQNLLLINSYKIHRNKDNAEITNS